MKTPIGTALCILALNANLVVRADWLAMDGQNNIWRLADTNGAVISQFAYLTPYHQEWVAMTIGPDRTVFVSLASDINGNQIQSFNPSGSSKGAFVIGPYINGKLYVPGNLTVGPDGNVYIADNYWNSISRYNGTNGAFLGTFVSGTHVNGLTFGPDGNLYVADATLGVVRYNGTNGDYVDTFVPLGTNGVPDAANLLFGPDGNLYVASAVSNAVVRFGGSSGQFMDYFVPPGSGGLSSPKWLAFGPDRNLYVTDGGGNILRYDGQTGAFLNSFGSQAVLGLVYLPDTNPPVAIVTSPTNGATVSGSITVSADASDDGAVAGVQFQLDGQNLGAPISATPYTVTWDTTTATDGAHALTVIAWDGASNQSTSAPVVVTVQNSPAPDTTPPAVTVTAPADNATVSGAVSISADATDNVSVAYVQFQMDGANLGWQITNAPYALTWNSATATNGAHVLRAVTRDLAGNQTVSSPVTLTVTNSDPGQILFVSDTNGNILKISADGSPSVFASGTNNFYGLAFDRAGNLFASAYSAGIIYKFTPDGASSAFNNPSNACQAYSLTFDDAGNLFANCASVISKFTSDGSPSPFAGTATPSRIPSAEAFDAAGNLYVTAWIFVYTPSYHPEDVITRFAPDGSSRSFTTGGGYSGFYGMAFDSAGELFYSDYAQGNIYQFTPDGTQSTFVSGLNHPTGLAFDNAGNLYEADQGSGNIYKIAPDGTQTIYTGGLNGPIGLALAPAVTTPDPAPQIPPSPSLSIQLTNHTVQISWPSATGTNWVLCRQQGFPSTNAWTAVTNQPAIVGANYVVIEPCASNACFYRLEKR